MLNISDELRQIYKGDIIPNVSSLAYKQLNLYFPELDLTITNDKIVEDSFRLEESLCSSSDLSFGSCESAQIKITVADITQDLKGETMVVSQIVNNTYTMPLGTYKVDSAKKQSDLRFKDIIAYDNMTMFDVDVSSWYNALTFPMTLSSLRASLCNYIGITCATQTLPNDTMTVTKTITPTTLSGRDVLKKIAEINGCFGHITRDNKLKFIGLSAIGLYPSETLYPAEDLFPSENSEYLGVAGYKNSQYEEYTVQSITSLQIREQEGDIGVTVGSGDNCYIVQDNFLTFGKNASELTTIANNMLVMIKNKTYRPHTTNIIGLPYLEVGDAISIVTNTDVIETFVLKRTLTGIQALNDEISASGNEKREATTSISQKIEQINSKQMKIKSDLDGLSIEVSNKTAELDGKITENTSSITQTAESIAAEVTRAQGAEESLAASIQIQADQIGLKVTSAQATAIAELAVANGLSSFTVTADKIKLEGLTTINNSFSILQDGTAYMKNGWIDTLAAGSGYIDVKTALALPSVEYLNIGGKYPSMSGHAHSTEALTASRRSSDTVSGAYLTSFDNTSGTSDLPDAAFVIGYVQAHSDERIKKNIVSIQDITEKYMQLNPIEYDWKLQDGHDYGFGAHGIHEIFPNVTRLNKLMSDEEKALCPDGVWEIKYNDLHALHTKMIQKHEVEINALLERIEKIERKRGIKRWIKRIRELIGRINRQHRQH